MENLVFKGGNNQALTNSLLVAKKFERRHADVIVSIDKLILANAKVRSLYESATYIDEQGKERPMYIMNRDGFTLLVMGFNGKKALDFKMDYISEFNEMEDILKSSISNYQNDPFIQLRMSQIDLEKKVDFLEKTQSENTEKIDYLLSSKKEAEMELKSLPFSVPQDDVIPELSIRDKINILVRKYATASQAQTSDIWNKIYHTLYYNYRISIKAYPKLRKSESYLEVAERKGFIETIFIIATNVCKI